MRCSQKYRDTSTPSGVLCKHGGPKTKSGSVEANVDYLFVKNELLYQLSLLVKSQQNRTELVTRPEHHGGGVAAPLQKQQNPVEPDHLDHVLAIGGVNLAMVQVEQAEKEFQALVPQYDVPLGLFSGFLCQVIEPSLVHHPITWRRQGGGSEQSKTEDVGDPGCPSQVRSLMQCFSFQFDTTNGDLHMGPKAWRFVTQKTLTIFQ